MKSWVLGVPGSVQQGYLHHELGRTLVRWVDSPELKLLRRENLQVKSRESNHLGGCEGAFRNTSETHAGQFK